MKAIILVGGGGTRLWPLTQWLPKPLVPVLNRPLISHIIGTLRAHGVEQVVLAASASTRGLQDVLGDGTSSDVAITYSYEAEPLGSGLAVKQAASAAKETFIVCNGDVISDINITQMVDQHRQTKAILSISLTAVDDPSSYGVVQLGPNDRLLRFVEKPSPAEAPSNWANAGIWIFEPEVLDAIPNQRSDGSLERVVFPSLIEAGSYVQGFRTDAYWMDVGTPERYLRLHRDLLNGLISSRLPTGTGEPPSVEADSRVESKAELDPRTVLGSGCRLNHGVRVQGTSVMGDGCVVGEDSMIVDSVLWNNVSVGPGALIRDSIVADGCSIGRGAVLMGSVLAKGARVKDGVEIGAGTKISAGELVG